MSTSVQWATHSETSARGGWMLGSASPRLVSKPRNRKIAYAKTSSRSPSHRGWLLSSPLPHPKREACQPVLLGKTSEAAFLNYQKLSAEQIDEQSENGLDWISCLPSDELLEILNLSLLGVNRLNSIWLQSALSVEELVQLTQQAKHYPVNLSDGVCWSYTCCLQLVGLGRVRFVVCRQNNRLDGAYAALITNRLDWSPRKVISQCLQLSTLSNLLEHRSVELAKVP